MLVSKKAKNKNKLLLLLLIIILLVASSFIYVYAFNGSIMGWKKSTPAEEKVPSINYDEPTKEQVDAGNDIKQDNNPATDTTKGGQSTSAPTLQENGKYTATVTIINAGSKDTDGNINIRASIDAIDSSAECTLNILSSSGEIVTTQKVKTQAQSSYSSCLGFTVNNSILSPGSYTTQITYSSSSYEGVASATFKL